jgi:hypothetical protein
MADRWRRVKRESAPITGFCAGRPDVYRHRRTRRARRGWDSNPRYGFPYTRFPSVRLKPLGHLSTAEIGGNIALELGVTTRTVSANYFRARTRGGLQPTVYAQMPVRFVNFVRATGHSRGGRNCDRWTGCQPINKRGRKAMDNVGLSEPDLDEQILTLAIPDEVLERAATAEQNAATWVYYTHAWHYCDWPQ